jgi:hypothetical protein
MRIRPSFSVYSNVFPLVIDKVRTSFYSYLGTRLPIIKKDMFFFFSS